MFGRCAVVAVLLIPFLVLAILGLIVSLISHTAALLGLPQPLAPWMLHIGIFVVGLPTLIVFIRLAPEKAGRDFPWKLIERRCPPWLWLMTFGCFAYGIISFLVFAALGSRAGTTQGASGPPAVFGGIWMAGYSWIVAALYAAIVEITSTRR